MTSARLTCAERREAVLEAALAEFAAHGVRGQLQPREIARRVGISQPYVFRLFGTKRDLFKAAVRRCSTETLEAFERAAAGKRGRHVLNAIAASNRELLHTRPRQLGRLHTILVLTGSTIPDDVERHPYRPSRIVDSVADLLAELEEEAIAPTPG